MRISSSFSSLSLIIILASSFILLLFSFSLSPLEGFEQKEDVAAIEMVIARYNESLDWLKEDPFVDIPHIVYNKSDNDNFHKLEKKLKRVVPLKNVGRETHSYLQHIVDNYDALADVTVFLPGSVDLSNKFDRSKTLVSSVRDSSATTFSCMRGDENIKDVLYDFSIDKYMSSHDKNKTINSDDSMKLSEIRPFGKWFTANFGQDAYSTCSPWNALFAVTREDIRRNPKEHYEKLLSQVDNHQNHESAHYFERAWETVFSATPLPTTKYTW